MPVVTIGYMTDKQAAARAKLAKELAPFVPRLVGEAFAAAGLRKPELKEVKYYVEPRDSRSGNVEPLEVIVQIGPGHDGSTARMRVAIRDELFSRLGGTLKKMMLDLCIEAEVGTFEVDVQIVPMSGGVVNIRSGKLQQTWGNYN